MYISTSCAHEMDNDLEYNQLQNRMNIIEKENTDLHDIINNMRKHEETTNAPTPSPTSNDITLDELLIKLNKIDVNQQIDRINNVYKKQMGWNYSLNIDDILSNKQNKQKTLTLTAWVMRDTQTLKYWKQKYGPNIMKYAYDTKLVYANLHKNETILILDTFDYITYLNIETFFVTETATNDIYDEWNNMLSPYFSENTDKYPSDTIIDRNYDRDKYKRFNCTNLLNQFWWKRKRWVDDNKNKYYFRYKYGTTNHFNKILSILYWSKYFDYILWMDDDAFFGNFNISINYYFNIIPNKINNDIFLILPMDHNRAMVFSNFAFMINTTLTSNNRATNFLYEWFNGRSMGFQFYDQDAMNYAILQYLIKYDNKFRKYMNEYYLYLNPFKYLLFFKCIEYCKICPVDHMCLDNCLRAIRFKRCNEMELLQKKTKTKRKRKNNKCTMMINSTLFWSPWIDTNISSNNDDYNIYPFVFQNAYDAHYRYLTNKTYRDPELTYLKKIYDHTFIIHKRYYLKRNKLNVEHIPFLYAYTTSNSRRFVVEYLKKHKLYLNDSDYESIQFETRFKLNKLLTDYQNAETTFTSYGGKQSYGVQSFSH